MSGVSPAQTGGISTCFQTPYISFSRCKRALIRADRRFTHFNLGWFRCLSDWQHQATQRVCQPRLSQHLVNQGLMKTRVNGILFLLQSISSIVLKQITFSQDKSSFPDPDSSLPKAILKTSGVGLCTYWFFLFCFLFLKHTCSRQAISRWTQT